MLRDRDLFETVCFYPSIRESTFVAMPQLTHRIELLLSGGALCRCSTPLKVAHAGGFAQ
jgi:hypothetical protein